MEAPGSRSWRRALSTYFLVVSVRRRQPAIIKVMPKLARSTPLPYRRRVLIRRVLVGALIFAAGFAVYSNSFRVPFLFDDLSAIIANPTIRHLGRGILFPPHATTVENRPLLNISVALNFAVSGSSPWSYHAANLAIHLCNALLFFGIVRRTYRFVLGPSGGKSGATLAALAATLVWLLHPLNTEAVTYVVQRAESLMALFFLGTLYLFIRGVVRLDQRPFLYASVFCCFLGMTTKEVMAVAPIVVLLYDRTFVAGTFRAAIQSRHRYYLWLAASWIVLACVISGSPNRASVIGVRTPRTLFVHYVSSQPVALVRYLGLAAWPAGLTFDYGVISPSPVTVALASIVVVLLLAATVALTARRHPAGFAMVCFFLILAPTSLVPGSRQSMAEHRMYLPLAAIAGFVIPALFRVGGRKTLWVLGAASVALGIATFCRNAVYHSAEAIWADTVAKCPGNAYAHNNLGSELLKDGRLPEAMDQLLAATRLDPTLSVGFENLGSCYLRQGKLDDAIRAYRKAIDLTPGNFSAHNGLGVAFMRTGRLLDARAEFIAAIDLERLLYAGAGQFACGPY